MRRFCLFFTMFLVLSGAFSLAIKDAERKFCRVDPPSSSPVGLDAFSKDVYCHGRIALLGAENVNAYEAYITSSLHVDDLCKGVYKGVPFVKEIGSGASPFVLEIGLDEGSFRVMSFPAGACPLEKKNMVDWKDTLFGKDDGVFEPLTVEAARRCIDETPEEFSWYIVGCPAVLCDSKYDYTGEGIVSTKDNDFLAQVLLKKQSCPMGKVCDVNADGKVSSHDLQSFVNVNSACLEAELTISDSDGDGVIDAQDGCLKTPAGKVINNQGCLVGDISLDDRVDTVDVTLIKMDSSSLWGTVGGDLKAVNGYIQTMMRNWG